MNIFVQFFVRSNLQSFVQKIGDVQLSLRIIAYRYPIPNQLSILLNDTQSLDLSVKLILLQII